MKNCLLLYMLFSLNVYCANFLESNMQFSKYLEHARILDFSRNAGQDSINLEHLKTIWRNKKDLKIRVLGDSHIAADFLTHELRLILGNTNSIGFAYPLMPRFHQNVLIQYESENFEIVDSRKSMNPQLEEMFYKDRSRNPIEYPLGGIIAFAATLPAYISVDIKESLLDIDDKIFTTQIVFQGDSNQESFEIIDSNSQRFILKPTSNQWEIAQYTLSFPIKIYALSEHARLGGYFVYKDNNMRAIEHLGVNGVRSDIWLKWNLEVLKRQLSLIQYDVIILCYGSNDATLDNLNKETFIHNYVKFIKMFKVYNPNATILLVSPPPVLIASRMIEKKRLKSGKIISTTRTHYNLAKSFDMVRDSMYEIARQEHTLLFDISDFIEKTGEKEHWIQNNLSKKDVHLSPAGYKLIAHAIYKALENNMMESKMKNNMMK